MPRPVSGGAFGVQAGIPTAHTRITPAGAVVLVVVRLVACVNMSALLAPAAAQIKTLVGRAKPPPYAPEAPGQVSDSR